ncbi:selenide, water dikinase SelD [Natrinema halophilum]|uniref:selenide, water dikinase SelD n=1 Tax=Natrinema halophilum TaxID=1699371 RepID=UPI001F21E691|nr:selenide, water dikinase SelD [Natrinema halophilum]UHQ96188.1 selenide, water dikinase SelD [Natrinema halophilum]
MSDAGDDRSPALTEYAELHGCSCKVGQAELDSLLTDVGLSEAQEELQFGVGEDASARVIADGLSVVSTIDFFTPIIDDPYEFGRIAACNAASDAFATGAGDDLTFLVVLGLPQELTDAATDVLCGIVDAVDDMEGVVAGGHTIMNPWPIAGGSVIATTPSEHVLQTSDASPSDRLYLTKPLGTQPAMGALRVRDGEFGETIAETTARPVQDIADEALAWMTTPNRDAMLAAREYATAATDITGFGLLGQARVLAENAGVGVELTHLPIIDGTLELSQLFGYGLEDGESAETSGGLLLAVPDRQTDAFESSLSDANVFYRHVGRVTTDSGATIVDPTIERVHG